jgi:2-C-methyl-D-erythritol 4-phosphate cytidylyltransferase
MAAVCSVIIVAAGSSRRMGFNKLLAPLAGQPVVRRTVEAFAACEEVAEIILVGGEEVAAAVQGVQKVKAVVPGGAERHLSVWAGLQAVSPEASILAVHDGGRPLISPEQISRCISAAAEWGAVACARPVTETLKRSDANGRIIDSIDRTHAWVMETPQVFQRELLLRAYEAVLRDGALVTDEVSAVQHVGAVVSTVNNSEPNLKITYPADLQLAETLWVAACQR